MALLASNLSILLGRPVADMTQLTGRYDFTVEVSPDDTNTGPPIEGAENGVSVYTSVKSCRLKLEARKIPLDIILVDHVERKPVETSPVRRKAD